MVTNDRQVFNDFIRTEGLRETRQRALVLDVFLGTSDHVSAEDIYRLVNRTHRSVGFATVYRTMKLLAGCGVAREVTFDDGVSRFERVQGRKHHHHLVCTRCRNVTEFSSSAVDDFEQSIQRQYDFEPRSHHYEVFGLCGKCRGKSGSE